MQRIGFKEWGGVCHAILSGRQTVIIRKGGIAEGRAGFSFKEKEFYLFPTRYHEEAAKIREPEFANVSIDDDNVVITCAAKVEWAGLISDWPQVQALAPFHIWREEVIRERFDYDKQKGVHAAFIRAFRLEPVWIFPNEKRFGGCRSWVELPEHGSVPRLETVLSDSEFAQQREKALAILRLGSG